MDIAAIIASGILENYCLGAGTIEESAIVEKWAAEYPAIRQEIDSINRAFENYFLSNPVKPADSVKYALMKNLYRQQAETDPSFPPLLDEGDHTGQLVTWLSGKFPPTPQEDYENLFVSELPSTPAITNFFVYAKKGHDEEMHVDFKEYLYIIAGSCTMDFNGTVRSYRAGELISILPHVPHTAVVTSGVPMIALVQRQACA